MKPVLYEGGAAGAGGRRNCTGFVPVEASAGFNLFAKESSEAVASASLGLFAAAPMIDTPPAVPGGGLVTGTPPRPGPAVPPIARWRTRPRVAIPLPTPACPTVAPVSVGALRTAPFCGAEAETAVVADVEAWALVAAF